MDEARSETDGRKAAAGENRSWATDAGRVLGRIARQAVREFDEIARHTRKALNLSTPEARGANRGAPRPERVEVLVQRLADLLRDRDAESLQAVRDDQAFWALIKQLHFARVRARMASRERDEGASSSDTAPSTASASKQDDDQKQTPVPEVDAVVHDHDRKEAARTEPTAPEPGADANKAESRAEATGSAAAEEPDTDANAAESASSAESTVDPAPGEDKQSPQQTQANPVADAQSPPTADAAPPAATETPRSTDGAEPKAPESAARKQDRT